jgi:cell division protein FtsW
MRRPTPQQPLEHRLLLTATYCLLAGGAVMVYSASSARTLLQGQGDGTAFLVKYLAYGGVGLVGMHVISRRGLATARRATPLLLLVAFVMLLLVLLPGFGVRVNGARRWLGAGPLVFQPSEVMKLALVLHAAAVISARPRIVRSLKAVGGPILGVGGCAMLLIVAEPDLGTALVIAATLAAMLVAAGLPVRQLGLVAGAAALVILLVALVEPYRRARLTAFVHPWSDAGGSGFQAVQGQIAIGSGGVLGLGIGGSIQKIFYLPEAHTDFILAVIAEELGLAGVCAVRHDRVRGATDRAQRGGRLRQAARRGPDLADLVPSAAQRLRRRRPSPADRRAVAVHLVRLDVAGRAAGRDGAAAQHRLGRVAAPARRAGPSAPPARRAREEGGWPGRAGEEGRCRRRAAAEPG